MTDADARALIRRAHTDRAFRERVIAYCRMPMPDMPKETHASVHYRLGVLTRNCGLCTMFRAPSACTTVKSPIRAKDLCDLYVPKKRP